MGDLKKAFAIIGGIIIGVGVTYIARITSGNLLMLSDEMWILVGLIVTVSSAASLYFMTKSAS
ncbi:MAG: hypothetical protein QW590_03075 [Candidatus Bilamarchaeaceae archaeon]